MASNIDIDQNLLQAAVQVGHHKTKKAAINEALREYVQYRQQLEITNLFGKLDWDETYDYKKDRQRDNEDVKSAD